MQRWVLLRDQFPYCILWGMEWKWPTSRTTTKNILYFSIWKVPRVCWQMSGRRNVKINQARLRLPCIIIHEKRQSISLTGPVGITSPSRAFYAWCLLYSISKSSLKVTWAHHWPNMYFFCYQQQQNTGSAATCPPNRVSWCIFNQLSRIRPSVHHLGGKGWLVQKSGIVSLWVCAIKVELRKTRRIPPPAFISDIPAHFAFVSSSKTILFKNFTRSVFSFLS